jgi:hypothetical protein
VVSAIADALILIDSEGEVKPALATGWERVSRLAMEFELPDQAGNQTRTRHSIRASRSVGSVGQDDPTIAHAICDLLVRRL